MTEPSFSRCVIWTLQYNTSMMQEFNVNRKAECGQLNLAHVTCNQKQKYSTRN